MKLKDIILTSVGTVGLAGMLYGFNGALRSEINEVRTPAVQRIEQISRELVEIRGYDLVRDKNLELRYTALKGEYDTFMKKPLVREELQRAKEVYKEFSRDSVLAMLFCIPLVIPIGYYGGNYHFRKLQEREQKLKQTKKQ